MHYSTSCRATPLVAKRVTPDSIMVQWETGQMGFVTMILTNEEARVLSAQLKVAVLGEPLHD